MNGGYINEGGQLKSKNGQKYVINARRPGVYIPRYCIILTALLALAAMIVIAVLSYFLLSQASGATVIGADRHHQQATAAAGYRHNASAIHAADSDSAAAKLALSGIGLAPPVTSDTLTLTTTSTSAPATTTTDVGDLADHQLSSPTEDGTLVAADVQIVIATDIVQSGEGWNPSLYTLLLEPDFEASVSNGSVSIAMTPDELVFATSSDGLPLPIVLNINNITILSVEVTLSIENSTSPLFFEASYGVRNDSYVLRILEPLPGDFPQITVHLDFISRLSDTLTGFYKTTYRSMGVEQMMASTQFSPIDARRAFPCFDRPDKKAQFRISLVRHKNFTMALSNMPSIKTSYPRPDFIREDFDLTPRMSTYLVAFVVSNLVPTKVYDSIVAPDLPTIRVWTRPKYQHETQFMYTQTTRMLSFLDRYFDIPFGLPKIDLVAVPEFGFSAMENWGLITFRESGLVVPMDEKRRSLSQTQSACSTLAHEIAHQWFGNLVTMRDWNDLWLKEGFATYIGAITIATVEPTWHIMDYFSHSQLQRAMRADADDSAHPISFPVNSSADIRRMFDPISYSKGASIVAMLNGILGEHTFKTALRAYLQQYRYSNAVQDDLWRILTKHAHETGVLAADMDVKTIMDTWTLQPGYPVLQVILDPAAGTVRFTQQRYLRTAGADAESHQPLSNASWYIPITFETGSARSSDTRPMHWLRPLGAAGQGDDGSLTLHDVTIGPKDWLYANIRRIGYYRVNYDRDTWLELSINFYDLPAITQGALLDDSLALSLAGLLPYDVPLTFLMKLAGVPAAAVPLSAVESGMQFLSDMLIREQANGDWRALMRYVLKPMLMQVDGAGAGAGGEVDEGLQDDQRAHKYRVMHWACHFGLEPCVKMATKVFQRWLAEPNVVVAPDLLPTVLCTALRKADSKTAAHDWQRVYERYMNQSSASEKHVYLAALGCTEVPWLLSRYLNMTLNPLSGIRKQDGAAAFGAIASNPIGNELALDFLATHIEQFSKYYGDGFSTISKMIGSTTIFANLPTHLAKYEAFAASAHKLGLTAIEKSLRLQLTGVQNNVHWRQHQYYELERFLSVLLQQKMFSS